LLRKGVIPCGLGSRDTLRFEAALPLYGHEISDQITPLEAGFKMFVDFNKADFIGKEQLVNQLEKGLRRRVVGLELTELAIPRQGYPVYAGEREIGHVTTGYLSITLNKPIALALVEVEYAKQGTIIAVEVRKKRYQGFIRDKKFLVKNYKKKEEI
jgi:aminomethyltransferase